MKKLSFKQTITYKKKTNYERVFFFIWTLYSLEYGLLAASELPYMYSLANYKMICDYAVIFLLMFLFIASQNVRMRNIIKYMFFLILIALIELSITDKTLLIMALFMITAQKIDFEKIVRYDIKIKIFLLVTLVSLSLLGVINNYQALINGNFKQAFGFSHPNTFSCFAYVILLEWIYLRFDRLTLADWVLQIICSLLVLHFGGGRASGYTYYLILLLFWIAKVWPRVFFSRPVRFLFIFITPIMALLSFLGAYLYSKGNSIMVLLNQVITSRMGMAARFLETYDITLFGQEIETVSTRRARLEHVNSLVLDCAYVRCILMYGLLFFILFIVVYMLLFRKILNRKYIPMALFSLYFVILGIGEAYMLNVLYNLTLLFFLNSAKDEKITNLKEIGPSKSKVYWRAEDSRA